MRFAGNLLGLPAAAVPMGFVEPERLPLSLEIAGPPLGDGRVLAVAELFQERTRWHLRRPVV
jgi:aspartyl-tRNA(Asn)/glutamyl-tRNA(Gln) amidotransferase subunit A